MNQSEKCTNKPVLTVCREVRIKNTVYHLTSKFEGKKNLDETLKRLAIRRVGKAE